MVEGVELTRDEPASDMFAAFTKAFRNYFNFKGRTCRYDYWAFCFVNFMIGFLFTILGKILSAGIFVYYGYSLLVFIPMLAIFVRRLHDVNKSFYKCVLKPLLLLFILSVIAFVMFGIYKVSLDSLSAMILLFFIFSFVLVWEITLFVFICFKGKAESNKYGAPIIEDDSHVRRSKWLIFFTIVLPIIMKILIVIVFGSVGYNNGMRNLQNKQPQYQIDFDQNEPAEPIQIELKNIPGINVEQGTATPEE